MKNYQEAEIICQAAGGSLITVSLTDLLIAKKCEQIFLFFFEGGGAE